MRKFNFVNKALRPLDVLELFYFKKGEKVSCSTTSHSLIRFKERFNLLTDVELKDGEILLAICNLFNSSKKFTNEEYEKRNQHYGGGTLYFKNSHFVFVVKDRIILTAEIISDRTLNKDMTDAN